MILRALIAAASLAGSAAAAPIDDLIGRLTGRFDNAAQIAALPEGVAREPKPGSPWVAPLSVEAVEAKIPALEGRAIYFEWRKPDGALDRQRIWTFEEGEGGAILMRFYTFKDPRPFEGAAADPIRLAEVTRDLLIAYPTGCELAFARDGDGFAGRLAPPACRIVTQRTGRTMFIDAEIAATDAGFAYREAGVLEDGTDAFRVPGEGAIVFRRK